MSTFKEAGGFKPVSKEISRFITPKVARKGGIVVADDRRVLEVRPPQARLRRSAEAHFVNGGLAAHDVSEWSLEPEGSLKDPETPVTVGAEMEFAVLNREGKVVNLALPFGGGWLLDYLGASPEGLRFQAEFNLKPGFDWDDMIDQVFHILKTVVRRADQLGLLLLPTGEVGYSFEKDWSLILPHPYIEAIQRMLEGTALDFDAQTVQAHVDVRPFGGSLEAGHTLANHFNGVFATMLNAVFSASPFRDGKVGPGVGLREFSRRQLVTVGGVQSNYEMPPWDYVDYAHRLLQEGVIPAAERAGGRVSNGRVDWVHGIFAHNDTRVKVSSTGTFEASSTDMNPNPYSWLVHMFVVRRFLTQVARTLVRGGEMPAFLEMPDYDTRVKNRDAAVLIGPEAVIQTEAGAYKIRDLWYAFYHWALTDLEKRGQETDFTLSMRVILAMLDNKVHSDPWKQMELYFNPQSEWFMRGNFGQLMLRCARSLPSTMPDEERIRRVNLEVARLFRGFIKSWGW